MPLKVGYFAYLGSAARYVQAFAGYRAVPGPLRLGLVLAPDRFNRVDLRMDFQGHAPRGNPVFTDQCPTGTTIWRHSAALTVALDLP